MALTQSWAISGLGGIGKTQVALEYAYRYRRDYETVFWISAATQESLQAGLVALAEHLHLLEKDRHDHAQVILAVKQWLATHQNWLLILDNADDVPLVRDILPAECSGHLLLTTRAQALGPVARRIEVETMGIAESTLFLLRRAKLLAPGASLDQASSEQLAAAEAIAIEMDFLPLALDQAGAYIDEVGCSLSTYLKLYHTHRAELLRRRGHMPGDYPQSVATTWSLNFLKVEQVNPAAAELLRLCAFLEPDTIPEELIGEGSAALGPLLQPVASDAFALNGAIEELRKFSLVQRDSEARLLRIHRLVQAVLKDALAMEERCQWAERAVRATSTVFPDTVELATWSRCQRFLSQAQACSMLIQDYAFVFAEAATLLHRTACYIDDAGLYEQAKPLYKQALRIWEQALGPDHPAVAQPLKRLADLYRLEGNLEQAALLYQQAMHILEQAHGPEHPDVAQPIYGLAVLRQLQGNFEQAESLYQRALHILEQAHDAEHPAVAQLLEGLGFLYRAQGRYEQAESLYRQAMQIWEQTHGSVHPDVARSLNGLAVIYAMQGKFEQAEPLCWRALHIWEQTLGPDHPDVATPLNNLANICGEQGKFEQAEPLWWRALHIWEQTQGPEHPNLALPLNNLADLYRDQGKFEQAEPLYQRALRVWEQTRGPEHPNLAHPLNGLANLYDKQGMKEQAESLYQRALSIREHALGEQHIETAKTLHDFAVFQETQSKHQEAAALYQRALAIQEQILGAQHPTTTTTRTAYLALLRAMDQEEEGPGARAT